MNPPLHSLFGQAQPGKPPEDLRKGDLRLQPGEGRSDTVVNPQSECDVTVRLAPQVQPVWIGELIGISIGGSQHQQYSLPLLDAGAGEIE